MNKFKRFFVGLGVSIAALFGAHHFQPTTIEVNPTTVVVASPTPTATPQPNLNKVPHVELGKFTGSPEQRSMVNIGLQNANDILASDCFKKGVLAAKFTETNGLTNQQIYDTFNENVIKVNIVLFYGSWYQNHISKTIGYELDSDPNTCYQNSYYVETGYMSGSNILHECAHGVGFHHYQVMATSVPYQLNDIYDVCAAELGIKEDI